MSLFLLLFRHVLVPQRLYQSFHLSHATRNLLHRVNWPQASSLFRLLRSCSLLRSVNQLCSVTRTSLDNQSHHNGIHTLIAAIMNTFLETAQNDLIGEAVRWHVPTCASLYERQTTENTGRTESTKLDRLRILSTLERGFFTVC